MTEQLWTVRQTAPKNSYVSDYTPVPARYWWAVKRFAWRMTRARAAQCAIDLPDLELVIERVKP